MGLVLLATPLLAQRGATRPDTTALSVAAPTRAEPSNVAVARAPASEGVPSWVNAMSATTVKAPLAPAVRALGSGPTSENGAMMIVGGAALVVGAIIGGKAGTVIMVGGGVIGLLGLWNYAR